MTRAIVLLGSAMLTLACGFIKDDGPPPPANHVAHVGAACNACTPAEAVHECPPRSAGSLLCAGIPAAVVGDTMIVCGIGIASQGPIGALLWSSNNPDVATVTQTALTVTHCLNELTNARLDAKSPGSATITLQELIGGKVVSSASATIVVK
jgi:hypothetical protein